MTDVLVWNPPELGFVYLHDDTAYMPCMEADVDRYRAVWEAEGYEAAFTLSEEDKPPNDRRFRTDFVTGIWIVEQMMQIGREQFGYVYDEEPA